MFSATLGLSRGPSRSVTLIQLGLLNVAAILVIMGRLVGEPGVLAAGVSIFVPVIAWVTWQVHTMWSASVNRRFSITGTFYRLAGVSLLFGSSIGGALGIGAFNEPASYLAPRGIHSILNVFGWAGMTIVGTAITIVPTVLHVRSPSLKVMRPVPWLMAGGLLVMATGSDDEPGMAGGIGHGDLPVWACGFRLIPQDRPIDPQTSQSPDGRVVSRRGHGLGRNHRNSPRHRNDARRQRCDARPGRRRWRRRICIPSAPWSVVVPPPSTRAPVPQRRRVELMAMELGGPVQVVAFNLGVLLTLVGLRSDIDASSITGVTLAWLAALWVLAKTCFSGLVEPASR